MTAGEVMNGMVNVGGVEHDQQIWIGYYIPKNWRFELVNASEFEYHQAIVKGHVLNLCRSLGNAVDKMPNTFG